MPRWGVKMLAVGPGPVISAVALLLVQALLPPAIGAALFIAAVGLAVLVSLGRLEGAAAAVLLGARRPRPDELSDLAPALMLPCQARLGPPIIDTRVGHGHAISAAGIGRRTVVVTTGLLKAVADGDLPPGQVAAVMAHGSTLVRAGLVRHNLLIAWLSLPRQMLHAIADTMARHGRQPPLTVIAWRLRAIVITVAVLHPAHEHHLGPAAVTAAIGALSCAMPIWRQHWQTLLRTTGDQGLEQARFTPAMAAFRQRHPATNTTRTPLRTLTSAQPTTPALGLVRR